ncbi:hypothetical protein GYMLUDRAFT_55793 [Collybiopsis luxurians FD-317 M1]|nr:hypothetical protein GYMLUDRAFT_55793 [Collybiopsis luxurians FD-317 M1]
MGPLPPRKVTGTQIFDHATNSTSQAPVNSLPARELLLDNDEATANNTPSPESFVAATANPEVRLTNANMRREMENLRRVVEDIRMLRMLYEPPPEYEVEWE